MEYMVMYNTLMSLAAGVGLIGFAWLGRKMLRKEQVSSDGWALLFGVTGTILSVLGTTVSVMWPYNLKGVLDANILFGEPSIMFGLLLLAAAFYLWQRGFQYDKVLRVMKPVSIFVFAVGLAMTACAISWVRYRLGAAPSVEPISGLFADYPVVESTFLGLLYGLVAIGCLLFPWGIRKKVDVDVLRVVFGCWIIAGVIFLGFGALNYYTHIGMIQNTTTGTEYKI